MLLLKAGKDDDALWARGAPWLALSASDDRMDSLLSRAVLTSAGALPLVTGTLRGLEDVAVALVRRGTYKYRAGAPIPAAWSERACTPI